jgi:deoxyribodipyrimidine photo-lyase
MANRRALIWLKRDLRLHDHSPLCAALACRDALALFIIEPAWLQSAECAAQHVEFTLGCLAELRHAFARRGLPLVVRVGAAVPILESIHGTVGFTDLYSHEETGPGWSFERDRQVARWCRATGVLWHEFPQHGVIRRLGSRTGWGARWQERMDQPAAELSAGFHAAVPLDQPDLPDCATLGFKPSGGARQAAGEAAGLATLRSFLAGRALGYRQAMSSPLSAEEGCGRISPYLAFGCLSLRRAHQDTESAIATTGLRDLAWHLQGFASRLRWHCHFMQKFEDEPAIEFRNFSRALDGLREEQFDEERFAAWCAGQTGFPLVDACVRSLRATGWLNFRMRAMLVSFAAYHLWLHWRRPGQFLGSQFLDFEAGIHWSQMQMQSGTTGINTLRIYSPTKQARDQDPDGRFIRRWVPELARVPLTALAEPWTMPPGLQRQAGCVLGRDYPLPIVDEKAAAQAAKERIFALRATDRARTEADAIQARHGSRKSGLPAVPARRRRKASHPVASPQRDLFS